MVGAKCWDQGSEATQSRTREGCEGELPEDGASDNAKVATTPQMVINALDSTHGEFQGAYL
jgi:hypothetical protein